ncbi:MAG TPA: amidohydrolase family protein [Actinomycetota bacterium]|nr:amidohydrolase family protein [Actinomycetota bacterium]
MERWRFVGVRLPEGEPDELWSVDGHLQRRPGSDAEPLPGRYVLPGLVDAHAHPTIDVAGLGAPMGSSVLVETNLERCAASGELLIREIGAVGDFWSLDGIGERLPRMQRAGRFLAPSGGYFDWLGVFTEPSDARSEVARQTAAGATWIKVIGDWPTDVGFHPNYEPEVLAGIVEAAHAAGARVGVHVISREATVAAIDAGVDTLEHAPLLDEDLVGRMAASGAAWTPTLSAVGPMLEGSVDVVGISGMGEAFRAAAERLGHVLRAARLLGVPVLAGTDVLPPGSIATEIAQLHRWGLTPTEALEAATTVARGFLGEAALEDGAPADLVTYDADPREDPEVLREPAAVVLGGRRIR